MRMGRRTLLVGALVAVARAYDAPPTGSCEAHCAVPCAELNGDVEHECDGCVGPLYACRPGADGYPNTKVSSQRRGDPQQVVDVGGVQQSSGVPKDHLAVGGEYVVQATAAAAARLSELERQRGELAESGEVGSTARVAVDSSGSVVAADVGELDGLGCAPHYRTLGHGARALRVCPILNGIWTSFLDQTKWGDYGAALDADRSARIAAEMSAYDAVGMDTWIGEDFDQRVLSALKAHRQVRRTDSSDAMGDAGGDDRGGERYSIIVEEGVDVTNNLRSLARRLGPRATSWVHLGPPALQHLPAYRVASLQKLVDWYGVEDYTAEMIHQAARVLPISTVQQEINVLVRPSPQTHEACRALGCVFVGYGPLLGGLLSDRYLGAARPHPDRDHSKQIDYLDSIDAWANWQTFQSLLATLRAVGNAHGDVPISSVALAYVLQLEMVHSVIVGVRLGAEPPQPDHRRDSLQALQLRLSAADVEAIEEAVALGTVLDGLART